MASLTYDLRNQNKMRECVTDEQKTRDLMERTAEARTGSGERERGMTCSKGPLDRVKPTAATEDSASGSVV